MYSAFLLSLPFLCRISRFIRKLLAKKNLKSLYMPHTYTSILKTATSCIYYDKLLYFRNHEMACVNGLHTVLVTWPHLPRLIHTKIIHSYIILSNVMCTARFLLGFILQLCWFQCSCIWKNKKYLIFCNENCEIHHNPYFRRIFIYLMMQ